MSSSPEPNDPGLTIHRNPRQLVRQTSLEIDGEWVPDDPISSPEPIFVVVLDSESKDDNEEDSDEKKKNVNVGENEANNDGDGADDDSNDKNEEKVFFEKIVLSKRPKG
ncbi:hypothetical protein L5515_017155 [Caenorhabditis briggsae]|uniref:Uncharacterized protein n=1 Tax=Caenorhabditis briggsae TaxID=6238 RepID=A0AAE9FGA9_CAEBR|nr:hypothetical protein L5515_017155 [Caenorhabditis briggsae]